MTKSMTTETDEAVEILKAEADAVSADDIDVSLTTETEWARSGTSFYAGTRADKHKVLPSGIYSFVNPTMAPWYMERTGSRFEFPFKVYKAFSHIIDRICKFWTTNGGNLGVLMNGLRGAGKTMTAQQLANRLMDELDVPVLVVRGPIPLQLVFDAVQQDLIVIFDEFEKTHNEEQEPGCQQQLLSTIDGMSRSAHNRLIIFTTNKTNINENFRDRPSRIHYKFEFSRIADEIIEGLINDALPERLMHLKPDIFEFLNTREICTIDIVKAVISEVRTFEETPRQFEDLLNIAKGEPPAYTIYILNNETGAQISTWNSYFRLDRNSERWSTLLSGNKRAIESFTERGHALEVFSRGFMGASGISLLERCEEDENIWLAQLFVPKERTPFRDFFFLYNESLWVDNKPADWKLHSNYKTIDDEERALVYAAWEKSTESETIYGTGERAVFKILIEANHNWAEPTRYKVTGVL